jgi:hypothetical protein
MVFDGVKSAPRYLSSGIPQGCILSPLFFYMFINDLCSCIRFPKFYFYADDLQIYLSGDKKDLDVMISALNEDLATILQWSVENELLLNPRKSQVVLIIMIFKLILTQRPGYLFADLIGARSVRTSIFIFPSVSPGASVLVRRIRLWN